MDAATSSRYLKPKVPFGQWLINQAPREDAIGELAKAAKRDPQFPRDGDFKAVSARLNQLEADPDMHIALEDAELDWAAF